MRKISMPCQPRPELERHLREARQAFDRMTPEQQQAMLAEQRKSWVRGELMLSDPRLSAEEAPRRVDAAVGQRQASFQGRTEVWAEEVFKDDRTDLPERVARFGEEALELQQALGQTRAEAHALVDYVYGRPVGEPAQELGGTMTTLATLATYAGLDMAVCGERELERCWDPRVIEKIRGKRAKRPDRGPLPGLDVTEQPR